MPAVLAAPPPPSFLKLIAHDVRWQMLVALARSDQRVQELVNLLDLPQNLVSYHLKRLREVKLVAERRSTADGREVYYHLDLERMRSLYLESGQALHPALGQADNQAQAWAQPVTPKRLRVLFLCTHNSARSQMAEGIMRHLSKGRLEVFSAGTEPDQVDPVAIQVMEAMRIDIRSQHAKHLDEFRGQKFDYIITVCDRVREACPVFPGDPEQIHWSFPDPAAVEGTQARYRAFKDTATQLITRINYLMLMIERAGKLL